MLLCSCFFFFSSRRRHTRWTGDWSSDVCSSDLTGKPLALVADAVRHSFFLAVENHLLAYDRREVLGNVGVTLLQIRSEERRVGKECRSRGWRYHLKKKV